MGAIFSDLRTENLDFKELNEFDVAICSQNLEPVVLIRKILRNKYLALGHSWWSVPSGCGHDRMLRLWKARADVTRFGCGKVGERIQRGRRLRWTILVWTIVILLVRLVRTSGPSLGCDREADCARSARSSTCSMVRRAGMRCSVRSPEGCVT